MLGKGLPEMPSLLPIISLINRDRQANALSDNVRPHLGLRLASAARPIPFQISCFALHNGNASHRTQLCIAHSVNAFKAQNAAFYYELYLYIYLWGRNATRIFSFWSLRKIILHRYQISLSVKRQRKLLNFAVNNHYKCHWIKI